MGISLTFRSLYLWFSGWGCRCRLLGVEAAALVKAVDRLRMRQHPSKVFSVPFVHNRRCQRVQCKRSLQIAERRGGRRSQKEQFHSGQCLDARRRLKERFNYFGNEPNIDESREARGNAAERQRSRNDADTGQSFGP